MLAAYHVPRATGGVDSSTTSYDLGRGAVVETVLKYVEESYIDPSRFDPSSAFEHSIQSLEALIPEFSCSYAKGAKSYRIQMNTQAKEVERVRLVTFEDYLKNSQQMLGFVQKTLKSEIKLPTIEYEVVNGFLETLDPHSRLMDPESYEEFAIATQL